MHSLKFKLVMTFLLAGLGYFLVFAFINFIIPYYRNPSLLLSLFSMWTLIIYVAFISIWLYALIRNTQSLYTHLKHGSEQEQIARVLGKETKSLEVLIKVAEKEFMRRNISKKTFEDIQRIAGKKMVEIKAKRRELDASEPVEKEEK
jgi:membrane protein implicated in regulation of membrane protease activity